MPENLENKSLSVQGTNNFPVPKEIRDYYRGRGISYEFLKKHYGLGRSLHISPDPRFRNQIPPF